VYDLCKEVSKDLIANLVRMNAILRHYFAIPLLCKSKEARKKKKMRLSRAVVWWDSHEVVRGGKRR
jgi:hypothetical protein